MQPINSSLLKKIRRIQYQTTFLVNDLLAGAYRSAFRGKGMEFEEVREYQMGDEVRTIDWNVTARMQHPYVKSFREEREITMTLLVDISSSTRYGSQNTLKSEIMTEIAAILAFSAIKNNDKVALLLFADHVVKYLPPKKGTRHVLNIIRELVIQSPIQTGTNIGEALAYLGKYQQHSGLCFLFSDFMSQDYSHEASLIAKKFDLACLAFVDQSEIQFPSMGLIDLVDLETGQMGLMDSNDANVLKHLQQQTIKRLSFHRQLMHKLGVDFHEIDISKPYLPQLRKFFLLRQMRRR